MEDRETALMRKYEESKTTRIMMATVPHVTSGLGLRKFQADGFLLTRVYQYHLDLRETGIPGAKIIKLECLTFMLFVPCIVISVCNVNLQYNILEFSCFKKLLSHNKTYHILCFIDILRT